MNGQLILAGRRIARAEDHVRRYCGLAWSGGPPEVWAFPYYDVPVSPAPADTLEPADVLRAAALHPGLSRQNLAFFIERRRDLESLLAQLPADVDLPDADAAAIDTLLRFADVATPGGAELSLVTKVLHPRRPRLIPILDRSLVDWYRALIRGRGAAAWADLVPLLGSDLGSCRGPLRSLATQLEPELGSHRVPSELRLADIALWMETMR